MSCWRSPTKKKISPKCFLGRNNEKSQQAQPKQLSSSFNDRPCLKGVKWRAGEKDTAYLWPPQHRQSLPSSPFPSPSFPHSLSLSPSPSLSLTLSPFPSLSLYPLFLLLLLFYPFLPPSSPHPSVSEELKQEREITYQKRKY